MNRIFLLIFALLVNFTVSSQELSIQETLNYINESIGNLKDVSVNEQGQLVYTRYSKEWQMEVGRYNNVKLFTMDSNVDDLQLSKYFTAVSTEYMVTISCKKTACWTKKSKENTIRNENKISFYFIKERDRDKVFNAMKYLIALVKNNEDFNQIDNDPFADNNFGRTYSFVTGSITTQQISLSESGGVYLINARINGIDQVFVLDSGASDVSISPNLERELKEQKKIKREDYIEPALYRIADGSVISVRRAILNEVKIGDFIVNNVVVTIGNNKNSPFLLGRGFLDNFKKWSIDNSQKTLTLTK